MWKGPWSHKRTLDSSSVGNSGPFSTGVGAGLTQAQGTVKKEVGGLLWEFGGSQIPWLLTAPRPPPPQPMRSSCISSSTARHQGKQGLLAGLEVHIPLQFIESGRDQGFPGTQFSCLRMVAQVPHNQELAPAGLLALGILRGGNVYLLSFSRTDMSNTLLPVVHKGPD